jgi:hypothetical protein
MIPMACPSCGRRGSVPQDKINSRLHCKKCDAIFHMDVEGHVVMGEPGRPAKPGGASGAFTVPGQDSGMHGKAPASGGGGGAPAAATAAPPDARRLGGLTGAAALALAAALVLAILWALGVLPPSGG